MIDNSEDGDVSHSNPAEITTSGILTASTLLALTISVPAIVVTLIMYYILKTTLTLTLIASLLTLFLAMGFGYRLSKKLIKIQQKGRNEDSNNIR